MDTDDDNDSRTNPTNERILVVGGGGGWENDDDDMDHLLLPSMNEERQWVFEIDEGRYDIVDTIHVLELVRTHCRVGPQRSSFWRHAVRFVVLVMVVDVGVQVEVSCFC